MDGWLNAITGLGGSRDKTTRATVKPICVLQPTELEALYNGNDLAAKIVHKLPREALRQGFRVQGDNSEALDAEHRSWGTRNLVLEAAIWGRLYGAGAILIGTDESTGAMDQPLDLAKVKPGALKYLLVLDRQNLSIVDYVENVDEKDYGKPRTYRITRSTASGAVDRSGNGQPIHASRLIMFGGALTSERTRLAKNGGFDLSVLQRPHDVLRDADQSWRSIMLLLQDLSQAVFKIEGLIDMIAEGEKDTMLSRMEVVDMARSVARAVVVDAEHESYEHTGAVNVTGIEPTMMMVFHRLAAAADMPLTRMIGMSPGGMNATGESDTRFWYDEVQTARDDDLTPALQRLTILLAANAGISLPEGEEPEIEWPSLWQMSPSEEAVHEKMRAETYKIKIDSGVLEPEEVTIREYEDDPAWDGIIDFTARRASLEEPDPEPPPQAPEDA